MEKIAHSLKNGKVSVNINEDVGKGYPWKSYNKNK